MGQKLKNQDNQMFLVEKEYNETLYNSHPFAYTRPEYLKAVAALFDVKAPRLETARILELGCASGGNIIDFSICYPNSYTLGIDLSKPQIDIGLKQIQELELKNIELKHSSIMDLDDTYGKFDYIICHGVFSWVPDIVRDKIFEISKKLLKEDGLALISYNTLPGWNMAQTIREMQLFHSEIFANITDKVAQSKLFVKFVNDSLSNSNSSYARFLKEETDALEKHEDYYIAHEYLSTNNKAFYFHEFMEMAAKHDLTYLAESNFQLMYTGNLPAKAAEKLATIPDIIRTEQYMDFIHNRRFRSTILQHKDRLVKRNIDSQVVNELYLTSSLACDKKLVEIDFNDAQKPINFYSDETYQHIVTTTSSSILKAILFTYLENIGNPLKKTEILKLAHKKIPKILFKDLETEFNNIILKLIFSGYIKIFSDRPKSIYIVSETPKVTDLVRYQLKHAANNKFIVTNQINEIVQLQPHEFYVIVNLDGVNTLENLENILLDKIKSGELIANIGETKITDDQQLKATTKAAVEQTLERARKSYLLIG